MTTGSPQFDWTEERVDRLKMLWTDGLSCSQIAGELGGALSRSAVVGKAHRLHLAPRQERSNGSRKPHRPRPRIQQRRGRATRLPGDSPAAAAVDGARYQPTAEDLATPQAQRCAFLDLSDEKCFWPIGDPGSKNFFFCGGKSVGWDSNRFIRYCARHASMAYTREYDRGGYVRNRVSKWGVLQPTNVRDRS